MRVALFFGSFNPIHVGHTSLAEYVLRHVDVDELWFVVSPHNPFKERADLAPAEERLELVRLVTEGNERLRASDVELRLPVPSYTVRTLEALEGENPGVEFVLVVGGDNLVGLPRWREAEKIIRGRHIVVYPRQGDVPDASAVEAMGGRVTILDAPLMDISSTEIRRRLSNGESVEGLVDERLIGLLR